MSQVFSTFAVLSRKESIDAQFRKLGYNAQQEYAHTVARMAESVDALVSNTSAARHAGSIPAPGTSSRRKTKWFSSYFHFPTSHATQTPLKCLLGSEE